MMLRLKIRGRPSGEHHLLITSCDIGVGRRPGVDFLKRIGGTMARVRLPSFSVAVVAAGGFALVALVVLRVAGIGDGGDAAPAEPELLGEPCVWFDHGHAHDGHLVNAVCVSADAGHVAGDHDGADAVDATVDPDELVPATRGAMPPAIPSFNMLSGEPVLNHLPPRTPELIAWSDWCFFGDDGAAPGASAFACSQQLAHFAWALTPAEQGGIAADESCVLEQERLYLQDSATAGISPAQALETNGWHRCASIVNPSPAERLTMTEQCRSLAAGHPQVESFLDVLHGGDCAVWADSQQFLIDTFGAPACSEAASLSMLWRQSVLTDTEMQTVAHLSLC